MFSQCSATYHGKEVVIALDLSGDLRELLVKSIRDVMSRIGGDYEDTLPHSSKLDSQTTARKNKTQEGSVQQEVGDLDGVEPDKSASRQQHFFQRAGSIFVY